MNSILHFAKLDMLSLKPYRKYFLTLLAPLAVVFDSRLGFVVVIGVLLLTAAASYLFASEEKNDMNRLYALLPVNSKDVVLGRYACSIIGALIYIVILALVLGICSIFTELTFLITLNTLITFVGVYLIITACQFPIFFKVGYIKGKFINPIIFLILIGIPVCFRQLIKIDILTILSTWGVLNSLIILAIGILAIIVSAGISIKLYRSRER